MSIIQNFYKAKLTRNWSATTGDFNVSVKPTSPNGWLVLSPNNTTLREIVRFTATGTNIYGDFITIANLADRGVGGTVAQTHTIGEDIRMNINAEYWAELIASAVAPTIELGTVTTLEPEQDVTITNSGDEINAVFNFGIPKGEQGIQGIQGEQGPVGTGSGNVIGPATNTDGYIPQWNGASSKTLKNGLAVPAGGLAGLTALGAKLDSSSFSNAGVTSKLITGYSSYSGVILGTDTILQAINKLNGNIETKQNTLTFGIANTNAVKIDHTSVVDNDYAKFTANGVEGRSYSEVLSDIGASPTASPTFSGTITLADNTRIDLTLPTVNTYCTGNTTDSFTSGYSSAVGDLVFFGSGGKWLESDADVVATCKGLMGIALEAKTDTQVMKVALPGSFIRLDTWNWTVGATLYAGETLGAMQETIPTGADAIIKVVGFAVSADVIYFNPSPDQQSVVA